ncbi:MAG: DUF3047 domain-containing protein [Burkholderiaceae bacterium]
MLNSKTLCAFFVAWLLAGSAGAAELTPVAGASPEPPSPWHVVGLPIAGKPLTRFRVEDSAGRRALRVEAESSYANLVHPLSPPATDLKHLTWQWRVELLNEAANLREKQGDDTTLKVCVAFDLPEDDVPLFERPALALARSRSSEPVPGATICYVWDDKLPIGTTLDNAFTRRVRYFVVESGEAGAREWHDEKRDVAADFVRLFGEESATVPAIVDVLIGADADNTKGHSIGYVTGIMLTR